MKKRAKTVLAVLLAALTAWMLFTGFSQRSDVYLAEYSVSEDGKQLTFTVGVGSSMGYVRECVSRQRQDDLELLFYSTFGGLNSTLGAQNEFTVELPENCRHVNIVWESPFQGGSKTVLVKDAAAGRWAPPV